MCYYIILWLRRQVRPSLVFVAPFVYATLAPLGSPSSFVLALLSKLRQEASPMNSTNSISSFYGGFNSADEVDPALIKKNAIPDAKRSWKISSFYKRMD